MTRKKESSVVFCTEYKTHADVVLNVKAVEYYVVREEYDNEGNITSEWIEIHMCSGSTLRCVYTVDESVYPGHCLATLLDKIMSGL